MKHLQTIEDRVNSHKRGIDMQLNHFDKVTSKRRLLLEHLYCINNAHRVLKQEETGEVEQESMEQFMEQERMEYICGVVDKT